MNEQEIRERLRRYDKERARGISWSVSHRSLGAFSDWMAEELKRQLERNHKLDKQFTEVVEAGEQMLRVPIKGEQHREAFHRLAQAMKGVKDGKV